MANIVDLKVGQRGSVRGREGQLMTVDRATEQVVFRADEPREQPVSSDGVRRAPAADLTVHAGEFTAAAVVDEAMTGPKASVPTKAQIASARKAAAERVKGEHLSAAKLDSVQDEAEAELVARMGRGESA